MWSATPERRRAMAELHDRALALHRAWLAVGWGVIALVLWGCLTPAPPDLEFGLNIPQFDKLEHIGAYLFLTPWFAAALPGWTRLLALMAAFVVMGGAIEIIQGYVGRDADWFDWFADCAGVALGAWYPRLWLTRLHGHLTATHA